MGADRKVNAEHKSIVKREQDHDLIESPMCGMLREIFDAEDDVPATIAVLNNIDATTGHYHETFDALYFMLDGWLTLRLHDPASGQTWEETLGRQGRYELAVVAKGLHHKVIYATPVNTLCVVSVPFFNRKDEHRSDKI